MKTIRRWHPREIALAGEPLKIKIKALEKHEAPDFLQTMVTLGRQAKSSTADEGDSQIATMLARLNTDWVRGAFQKYVRPDEEMQTESGAAITTGEALYDEANPGFVLRVLNEIEHLCLLTGKQGKDSSSPSISSAGEETGSGSSAAPSTANGSGAAPFVATETTTGSVLSSTQPVTV